MSNDLTDPEDRRVDAIVGFLGAGLGPAPSRATMLTALAEARHSVAASQARGEPIARWLENEARSRGVKENAATLAAMEATENLQDIAHRYRQCTPTAAFNWTK